MVQPDGSLHTDDMVFATVLCVMGYHTMAEKRARGVWWIVGADQFDEHDEAEGLVQDYFRGAMTVEPRRFAREMAAARKDVYRLMGVANQPQRTRVDRSVRD